MNVTQLTIDVVGLGSLHTQHTNIAIATLRHGDRAAPTTHEKTNPIEHKSNDNETQPNNQPMHCIIIAIEDEKADDC